MDPPLTFFSCIWMKLEREKAEGFRKARVFLAEAIQGPLSKSRINCAASQSSWPLHVCFCFTSDLHILWYFLHSNNNSLIFTSSHLLFSPSSHYLPNFTLLSDRYEQFNIRKQPLICIFFQMNYWTAIHYCRFDWIFTLCISVIIRTRSTWTLYWSISSWISSIGPSSYVNYVSANLGCSHFVSQYIQSAVPYSSAFGPSSPCGPVCRLYSLRLFCASVPNWHCTMLYSHVTLLMLRVVDVVTKTTVQQSARMQVAEIAGEIQVLSTIG